MRGEQMTREQLEKELKKHKDDITLGIIGEA